MIIVRKMEKLLSIAYVCWPVSACHWSCSCPPFSNFTKLRMRGLLCYCSYDSAASVTINRPNVCYWCSHSGQRGSSIFLLQTFCSTVTYVFFLLKNSWHNWFYVTKEAVRCLGEESEFPHLMVFTWWQVINNRDTLVELLAKHTGNVHIPLLSTFHKL